MSGQLAQTQSSAAAVPHPGRRSPHSPGLPLANDLSQGPRRVPQNAQPATRTRKRQALAGVAHQRIPEVWPQFLTEHAKLRRNHEIFLRQLQLGGGTLSGVSGYSRPDRANRARRRSALRGMPRVWGSLLCGSEKEALAKEEGVEEALIQRPYGRPFPHSLRDRRQDYPHGLGRADSTSARDSNDTGIRRLRRREKSPQGSRTGPWQIIPASLQP